MDWWARYVGLPFADGGRGPLAYDCWGLVRAVLANQRGLDLPEYGEISAHDLVRIAQAMSAEAEDGWQVIDVPQPFDVVLMRGPSGRAAVVHVGIMVDAGRVLHIEAATAAVVVPLTHYTIAGRIAGYRRRI